MVAACAVAWAATYSAVATLAGVGVAKTRTGVTTNQFAGRGVWVPVNVAANVTSAARVAAIKISSAVGVAVTIMGVGVGVDVWS